MSSTYSRLPKLKYHKGPIDKRALTDKEPISLIVDIETWLKEMGYFVEEEGCFKLKVSTGIEGNFKNIGFLKKLKMLISYGRDWDKGYNGRLEKHNKLEIHNKLEKLDRKQEKGDVVFIVQVQKLKNLDLYVVQFKRRRGDVWAFKSLYERVIGEMPIEGRYA